MMNEQELSDTATSPLNQTPKRESQQTRATPPAAVEAEEVLKQRGWSEPVNELGQRAPVQQLKIRMLEKSDQRIELEKMKAQGTLYLRASEYGLVAEKTIGPLGDDTMIDRIIEKERQEADEIRRDGLIEKKHLEIMQVKAEVERLKLHDKLQDKSKETSPGGKVRNVKQLLVREVCV